MPGTRIHFHCLTRITALALRGWWEAVWQVDWWAVKMSWRKKCVSLEVSSLLLQPAEAVFSGAIFISFDLTSLGMLNNSWAISQESSNSFKVSLYSHGLRGMSSAKRTLSRPSLTGMCAYIIFSLILILSFKAGKKWVFLKAVANIQQIYLKNCLINFVFG